MYSLDELPRVSSLNDEEVHSLDSEILDAEETHFTDTSDLDVSGSTGGRYRKHHRYNIHEELTSESVVAATDNHNFLTFNSLKGPLQRSQISTRSLFQRSLFQRPIRQRT